jgi:hypothetical protein
MVTGSKFICLVRALLSNDFTFSIGAVMKSRFSMLKSIVVAVALVAGVSGIARADDGSMSRLTGDSYAYFNGGPDGNPVFNNAPSAWRRNNHEEQITMRSTAPYAGH